MAIILKTSPRTFSPVYNKNEHCIFQDDAAIRTKPDYRYLFDIKISDYISGSTIIVRTKVSPDPSNALGVQDVQGFVEQYVKEHIVPYNSTDAIANTENAIISYFVEYGEEYRLTTSDPIVEYQNQLTGAIKWAWGSSLETHRWIDFYNNSEYLLYLFDTNNQGEFLTNYKTPTNFITDLGWHWYLSETPSSVDFMRVLTYDSAGALISTFDIPNNSNTAVDNSRMNSVATAPQSLNNITGAFLVGAQPVITSSVATYTIQCFQSPGTAVGEILYFTIDSECFYETYRIHFENEYGAFDSFNFTKNSKRSSKGSRKSYVTNSPTLSNSGISYKHSTENKVDYFGMNTDSISLVSDLIDTDTNNWLKEMAFTNRAFLEFTDSSGVKNFKPCKVLSTSWSESIDAIDKAFNFEVEIELADNFKQRT